MKIILQQSIRFILLILLQIFIFSQVQLFGYGIFFVYIFFILFLPFQLKKWQVLLISFFTGFLIDLTTGTYGLHMASATFIGFARDFLLRFIVKSDVLNDEVHPFRLTELKFMDALLYILIASFLFSSVFFLLDYFSLSALKRIGLQIIVSTVCTFIGLFIYRTLFSRQND